MTSKAHQLHLISEPESEYKLTPDEQAEKDAYLKRLKEYLKDPKFRQTPGFPLGEDEDILELSDPPYYTACPNPFLPEIIEKWQQERAELRHELDLPDDADDNGNDKPIYHREPFASDVKEGKYNSFYRLHPYPTKVPHRAIMHYILHYTDPGDVVLDGFAGTGMTALAAKLCGNINEINDLGYKTSNNSIINNKGDIISLLGERFSVINDLSTIATFIAQQLNTSVDTQNLENIAKEVFQDIHEESNWMFITLHQATTENVLLAKKMLQEKDPKELMLSPELNFGQINYVAWSDVFVCPNCQAEMIFWDVAVDKKSGKVNKNFSCPKCNAELTKRKVQRSWITKYDKAIRQSVKVAKRAPVLINYSVGKKRFKKEPDKFDIAILERIDRADIPYSFPNDSLPDGYNTRQPMKSHGFTHIHHFYSRRNLWVLASFTNKAIKNRDLLFAVTKVARQITHMYRFTHQSGVWGAGGGPLSGTLYIPSLTKELSVLNQLELAIKTQRKARLKKEIATHIITTQTSTDLNWIDDNSVDYIFVDPPFGSNLMYSELNYISEAWIKVYTNNLQEAIENNVQKKDLFDYQKLMGMCFREFYRVSKPNHWITVEFHNSQKRVWNVIQDAIQSSGFIVADVRTLDKKKKTFKQVTTSTAVKQDLIISAYKPRSGFEKRFLEQAGTTDGAWEFIRQHLAQLPVVVKLNGQLETLSERQDYLLFDRMVAFHIQRGATVPLSAGEFYAGLEERFPARDGMYFLPDQVPEYDRARLQAESVAQLSLFVNDEKTAIQWLRQQLDPKLGGEPQTYQDLQPIFLRQLHQAKHEALPELSLLLDQNFLQDEDDRWYVPDPHKVSDLEKLRRKTLLREFKTYLTGKKKLKQFRTEAVRAGFTDAYQRKDFQTILKVAQRLPKRVLQEDPDLLMYYDAASLRADT